VGTGTGGATASAEVLDASLVEESVVLSRAPGFFEQLLNDTINTTPMAVTLKRGRCFLNLIFISNKNIYFLELTNGHTNLFLIHSMVLPIRLLVI